MKLPCLLVISLGISGSLLAQSGTPEGGMVYQYEYDDSGNRVLRDIVLSSGKTDSTTWSETTPKEDESDTRDSGITVFKVYPNPTKDIVYITQEGDLLIEDIRVFSMGGREVNRKSPNQHIVEVDFSSYPTGTYLLWVKTPKGIHRWRIIKD